ncbi:MAG: hypothetical protein SPI61_00215 [Ezakiella sp.]|uniref:hypothetical protein n=1 Tax=Ezakiella sp. TaxID=1935205 RepID=UPI002A91181A|nr:hypothetical protein [Ezakiella sp.]MDY6079154.1 hypothetical protein [Ezakiella sp.]
MAKANNIAIYATIISHFMEYDVEELKEQVERGEAPKEWLDGYKHGIKEYRKAIIDIATTGLRKEQQVNEQRKLELYVIAVDGLIKAREEELRERVERRDISRQWLYGYMDGAIDYETQLLENAITIL